MIQWEDIINAAAEESFADFVWSPVVDGIFLPEPPTREYKNQKGLTDRFNFMITEWRISTSYFHKNHYIKEHLFHI